MTPTPMAARAVGIGALVAQLLLGGGGAVELEQPLTVQTAAIKSKPAFRIDDMGMSTPLRKGTGAFT